MIIIILGTLILRYASKRALPESPPLTSPSASLPRMVDTATRMVASSDQLIGWLQAFRGYTHPYLNWSAILKHSLIPSSDVYKHALVQTTGLTPSRIANFWGGQQLVINPANHSGGGANFLIGSGG